MIKPQDTEKLFISMNYVRNILDLVDARGGDGRCALVDAGIGSDVVDDPEAKVCFAQWSQFVQNSIDEIQDPTLGLYLGNQLSVMTHGNLGHAVLSSDDVRQALDLAIRYFETRTPLVSLRSEKSVDGVCIFFEERYLLGSIRRAILDATVSGLTAVVRFLTSGRLRVQRVEFAYSAPPNSDLYTAIFECPVGFDAKETRITLPLSIFETPLAMADKNVRDFSTKQCEEELEVVAKSPSLEKRIEQILLRFKGGFPSFEHIASELALSPRTLRRRLLERDTSFATLLDGVKYQLAIQYLETSSLSIQEIGYLLGYSDPSNFGRAFKKWSGQSPISYRDK